MPHSEYDIADAFAAIEEELIASMLRNMDRHRAEEDKEDLNWAMWQAEQLRSLEKYKKENQKKYGKQFKSLNKQLGGIIQQARQTGNMQQEIEILQAIKGGFTGYKKSAGGMAAEFFKLNDRKLKALIKATTADMKKAETAVLRMANDQYRKIIFNAQMYANSSAGTYEKAVDMATRDMLRSGLNCVEYKNGARHTLTDYVDMAIRTASKRAYLQGEGEKRREWGITTVIVNKRGNPCPKCLPFCGKVLIDDVWSGGSRKDGPYPLMSTAIEAGLYHPRCKDSHTTYFPGVSTADDTWTKKELEAVTKTNKATAQRQYAKRQEEKSDRLAKYSLDSENKKHYEVKAAEWNEVAELNNRAFKQAELLEAEFSPRKSTKGDFGVDWEKVTSLEYRERIGKLSDKKKVADAIEVRAKWALNNREGLKTEELYALSLNSGEDIASLLGQQVEFGVKRTKPFMKKLNEADRAGEQILLIHNHPRGLPPSIGDINALFYNKNVSGITVGHDGSIYHYTRPKKLIQEEDFGVALMRYSRYTETTGMEKALEDLSKEYGFKIRKL